MRDPSSEHPEVTREAEAAVAAPAERGIGVTELRTDGAGPLERLASLVGLVDFASIYLALALGVDPGQVLAVHNLGPRPLAAFPIALVRAIARGGCHPHRLRLWSHLVPLERPQPQHHRTTRTRQAGGSGSAGQAGARLSAALAGFLASALAGWGGLAAVGQALTLALALALAWLAESQPVEQVTETRRRGWRRRNVLLVLHPARLGATDDGQIRGRERLHRLADERGLHRAAPDDRGQVTAEDP